MSDIIAANNYKQDYFIFLQALEDNYHSNGFT